MGKLLNVSPELLFMDLFYNLLGHDGLVWRFFSFSSAVTSLHSRAEWLLFTSVHCAHGAREAVT